MHKWLVAIIAGALVLLAPFGVSAQDGGDARIRAVIIGNVNYQENPTDGRMSWKPLLGAYNDAMLIAATLIDQGVDRENITLITDKPSAELQAAKKLALFQTDLVADGIGTRANILGALKQVAETTRRGDEVLISFSGHGYYQKEAIPGNEPDGADEIFIPLDVGKKIDGGTRVERAITDDEIGAAIDAIRARGGNVTYIADFCHSGDTMRSAITGEASDLPEPDQLVERKFADIGSGNFVKDLAVETSKGQAGWGKFVAMMAAPSDTEAKQRLVPKFKPFKERLTHGVLTAYAVSNFANPKVATYRDLASRVGSNISEFNPQAPRPLFDGDLDRPLLGGMLKTARSGGDSWLVLKPSRPSGEKVLKLDSLEMSAGALQGVVEGAIVELSTSAADGDVPILYGRVDSVSPYTARLVPTDFGDIPATRWDDVRNASGKSFAREAKLVASMVQRPVDVSFRVALPAKPASPTKAQAATLAVLSKLDAAALGATFVAAGEEADLKLTFNGDTLAISETGEKVTDYGSMNLASLAAQGGAEQIGFTVGPAIMRAARFHKLRTVLASDEGMGTQENDPAARVAVKFSLLRPVENLAADAECTVPKFGRYDIPPGAVALGEAGTTREGVRIFQRCDILTIEIENTSDQEVYINPLYFTSSGAINLLRPKRTAPTRFAPGEKGVVNLLLAKAMDAQALQDELIILVSESGDGTAVSFAKLAQGPVLVAASEREEASGGGNIAATTLRNGGSRGIAVEDVLASVLDGGLRSGTTGSASQTGAVRFNLTVRPDGE